MKKIILMAVIITAISSCNNNSSNAGNADASADTARPANGVTNSEVTSTDTASMKNVNQFKNSHKDSVKK